jgi:hypothetical protein
MSNTSGISFRLGGLYLMVRLVSDQTTAKIYVSFYFIKLNAST